VGVNPETGKKLYYHHPYFQCANMFAGMFMSYFIFAIYTFLSSDRKYQGPEGANALAEGQGEDSAE